MDEMLNTAADTQPEASTEAAEDIPAAEEAARAPEDGLSVKFNKQTHTLSREQAIRYAQMGMKYDTVEPLLGTLKEVAAREGKTLAEWVATLGERPSPDPNEALAARLAEEYDALRREVPTVGEFSALPDGAVRLAAEERIPLLDAYLRWEHRERCRIEAERTAQRTAAAAATGALSPGTAAYASPTEAAMMRGIWGR